MTLLGLEEAKKSMLLLVRQSDTVMLGLEESEQLQRTKGYEEIPDSFFGHGMHRKIPSLMLNMESIRLVLWS